MSELKSIPATRKFLLGASSLLILATLSAEEAWAQSSQYNIVPQPVEQALAQFLEQEGLFLLNDINLNGLQSPGVRGSYTIDEALQSLLLGTGLSYELSDNGALVIFSGSSEEKDGELSIPVEVGSRSSEIDKEYLEVETVIVTGTNIRGVRNPTTPVLQFDREDIDLSGAATVEEFLRTIPQNFASETPISSDSANPFNNTGQNETNGTAVDLRGLGAGSTLTLLNGRRMTASGASSFVDVSVLPLGAIERVDVLTDGASAVYGSDAVGGVVNFITRKDFEGFDVNARYGTVTNGSKEDYGFGAAGGSSWGSGGAFVGFEYLDQTPLLTSERDFIDLSVANPDGTLGAGSERISLTGSFNQSVADRLSVFVDVLFSDRQSDVNFNTLGQIQSRSEQEYLFINSRLEYNLTQDISASLFFDYGTEEVSQFDSDDGFITESVTEWKNRLTLIEGQLSGKLLSTAAGDLSFALGGLYREETFEREEDFPFLAEPEREVTSIYGEFLVPIVGEGGRVPFIQQLELSLAGRYEHYSDFGGTFNPKIGLYWEISDEFAVRSSYSESFRAPDLNSLFFPSTALVTIFPSILFTAVAPPPQSPSAPPGSVIVLIPSGGNSQLTEETAKTWAAGFAYEPSFIEGLKIETSYYDINYEDRLESVNFVDILQISEFSILADIPPSVAEIDDIFALGASGDVNLFNPFSFAAEDVQVLLRAGLQNVARRKIRGADLNIQYNRSTSFGYFSTALNLAYVFDYIGAITEATAPVDQVNRLYRPTDLRLRGNVSWSRNGFTAFAAINYTDNYQDNIANNIDSWTTLDLSFAYNTGNKVDNIFAKDINIGISVQNVFNEDPPFVSTPADGLNFDVVNANPFGRVLNFTISKQF